MMNRKKQKIIAVCGVKNSGKTTFLVNLIKTLSEQGVKTAVIKHDGHDFTCDVEGTDSDRLKKAGAYGTAMFSDNRVFVHKTEANEKAEDLIALFPEAEVIFIEGMKDSEFPKIEIIRDGISTQAVSNPKGRFLIVTDKDPNEFGEPAMPFEEVERIAEMIKSM